MKFSTHHSTARSTQAIIEPLENRVLLSATVLPHAKPDLAKSHHHAVHAKAAKAVKAKHKLVVSATAATQASSNDTWSTANCCCGGSTTTAPVTTTTGSTTPTNPNGTGTPVMKKVDGVWVAWTGQGGALRYLVIT